LKAGALVEVTTAADDLADALASQLNGRKVETPGGNADVVILTEGLTHANTIERHWRVLEAARQARRPGGRLVLLQGPVADTGLEGLSRTLRKEWPDTEVITWTLLDASAPEMARDIGQALASGLGEGSLYRGAVSEPVAGNLLAPRALVSLPADPVWLITGGARGVTAACAIHLAADAGGTFLLAGRSAVTPWPQGLPDANDLKTLRGLMAASAKASGEKLSPLALDKAARAALAGREIRETLGAIAATGGRAVYLQMDAGDPASVERALASARETYGAITGLVHGAGVLADRLVMEKTEAELRSVFAPKVGGLQNILSVLGPAHLSHVALFSSAAAFFGNRGQSDYAMANAILARTGQSIARENPGAQVKVFHWGPWAGGMVDEALAGHFEAQGIPLIPIDEGARIFSSELLGGDRAQVELVVGEAWAAS
jgi:NAD(P)-dependent dehydrogenase (short-subunit alcohol dehydrogenase family)